MSDKITMYFHPDRPCTASHQSYETRLAEQRERARIQEEWEQSCETVIDNYDDCGDGYDVEYNKITKELTLNYSTDCGYSGGSLNLSDVIRKLAELGYISCYIFNKEG